MALEYDAADAIDLQRSRIHPARLHRGASAAARRFAQQFDGSDGPPVSAGAGAERRSTFELDADLRRARRADAGRWTTMRGADAC